MDTENDKTNYELQGARMLLEKLDDLQKGKVKDASLER